MIYDANGAPARPPSQDPETCKHVSAVSFDEEAAKGLSASEVRKRWPRGNFCPDCGFRGIIYASTAHFVAGDW